MPDVPRWILSTSVIVTLTEMYDDGISTTYLVVREYPPRLVRQAEDVAVVLQFGDAGIRLNGEYIAMGHPAEEPLCRLVDAVSMAPDCKPGSSVRTRHTEE
jgi:hypothetical protein